GKPVPHSRQSSPLYLEGRELAVPALHCCAHELQGLQDSAHGPAAQGLVAGDRALKRVARQNAREEAHGSARVSRVQRLLRRAEPAQAASLDCYLVALAFDADGEVSQAAQGAATIRAGGEVAQLRGSLRNGRQKRIPVWNGLVGGRGKRPV